MQTKNLAYYTYIKYIYLLVRPIIELIIYLRVGVHLLDKIFYENAITVLKGILHHIVRKSYRWLQHEGAK